MTNKSQTQSPKSATSTEPLGVLAQFQEAGFGKMMGMNAAWMEAFSDWSAEMVDFAAERIKADVKTQHDILQCKNAADLQHVQAQFMQRAMDQYHAETGKLVAMGNKAFGSKET